ncbi:MAG: tRNA pseudouridine(13) synthase TruD [Candidatus Hodarchaeota archaeon]
MSLQDNLFPPLTRDRFQSSLKPSQFNEIDLFCGMHPISTPRYPLVLKSIPEDFIVQEISPIGSRLPLKPAWWYRLPGKKGKKDSPIHVILVKRDCETFRLVETIKRTFNTPNLRINLAGIKDKRAVTSQRIKRSNNR